MSEPVFIPREGGRDEDDGWVVAIRHDEGRDESSLVILNAQDFDGAPAAEVILPRRVPYGAHGAWMGA
jgi:carotenoid cleavage dioxygenase